MDNNNVEQRGDHESQICKFYENKNVFITGGTGFLGKILVEKLLRTTDVSKLFLLVREKKGKNLHVRIDELFDDVIFQRLKTERPHFKQRILGIAGDISTSSLGLSAEDRNWLINNTNVLFHVAATVRFDERLDLAYAINVRATADILQLCKEMKQLKSAIYVSTAYSNCHLSKIEEVFYDYPTDGDTLRQTLEKLSEEEVEKRTPQLLGKWPNTYAFTKALAEAEVKARCVGLPIGMFRPAIVVSTYKEPVEAWIDNMYGPTGICVAAASGLLRTIRCDSRIVANLVPADMCVGALIASAWDVAGKTIVRSPENVSIYNFVSSCEKPITWGEYNTINEMYNDEFPFSRMIWVSCLRTTTSHSRNVLNKFFLHFIPAVLMDLCLLLQAQKPRLVSTYKKIHKFSGVIEYFCTNEWCFTNENTQKLWASMNSCDRQLFPMSMSSICWMDYFKPYMRGIRIYLLKDDITTLPEARIKKKRMDLLHFTFKYVLLFLASNLLWANVSWLVKWFVVPKDVTS